jgi:hypothetical protein
VKALKEQLEAVQESVRLGQKAATLRADEAQSVKALAEADAELAKLQDRKTQGAKEELRVRNLLVAAGKDEKTIAEAIAAVRKKYSDKGTSGAQELEAQADLLARLSGLTTTYNNDIARLNKLREAGTITEERYGEEVRKLVALQPYMVRYTKELAAEEAVRARDAEKYAQAQEKLIAAAEREVASLQNQYIELVAGKAVRNELQAARIEEEATLLEIQSIRMLDKDLDVAEFEARKTRITQLRQEAALRRGIAAATADKDVDAANTNANTESVAKS